MIWAVILAGGRGERFWPLSRQSLPKQFLCLLTDATMLQETVRRIPQVPASRVIVVTGSDYVGLVREQLPAVPAENVLGEPVGRNTGASVAWAAQVVKARDPEAVLLVLPSDHVIEDVPQFHQALEVALDHALAHDRFTLFGIVPERPDTGFGYIEVAAAGAAGPQPVVRFVEKPTAERAEDMVASGRFYWNSGMFVLPVGPLVRGFERFLPDLWAGIHAVVQSPDRLADGFATLPAVSLDVGLMEKTPDLTVVPVRMGWDDVGTFYAVARLLAGRQGERVLLDRSRDVLVIGEHGPWIAGLDLEHLVVVRTPDAILIMPPESAQDVRRLVARLREGPGQELL